MKIKKNNKGSAIIMFIIILFFFMLGGVVAIDYGMVSIEKARLQAAVDAGALAGANKMAQNLTLGSDISDGATNIVDEYITDKNNQTIVGEPNTIINNYDKTIEVTAIKNVQHRFAAFFKVFSNDVTCKAKAKVGPVGGIKGLRPFGLTKEDIKKYIDNNEPIVLKEGSNGGGNEKKDVDEEKIPGNFNLVDLDNHNDAGKSTIDKWIIEGYPDYLGVGSPILTQGGVEADTIKTVGELIKENGGEVIVIIPVIAYDESRNKGATIEGFAAVKLTEGNFTQSDGNGNGQGQTVIIGTFVKWVTTGDIYNGNDADFGTYATKLIN